MPDDKTKKGPADASKVNVHEAYELEYWTKTLNTTPQQLKDAVKKAGPGVEAVKKALGK